MTLKKHSVKISGHDTSITIEDEFWFTLKEISIEKGMSINQLIAEIDQNASSEYNNLSSAIRVFVLKILQNKIINVNFATTDKSTESK